MPEKSLEEILKQSAYNHSSNTYLFTCEDLRKAAHTIRDYYLAKVPKESVIEKGNQEFKKGKNFAIAEMRKAIEEG